MSVAFVREESAEAAQEIALPPRPISPYPNLVTTAGLKALQDAETAARAAVGAAEAMEPGPERRHALETALRDLEYYSERLRSAEPRPDPANFETVAFGAKVTFLREGGRRQTFRIVGEDESDPRSGTISYVSPLARLLATKRVGEFVEFDGREIEILGIG
jgi:transcription elongation GreA/GreB family factor